MPLLPTRSELRAILLERGVTPKRSLGQNFLTDHNMLRFIARAASLKKDDAILEIGAGTGLLTALLCEQAGCVVAVEIDEALHEICRERLGGAANVEFMRADILDGKSALNGEVAARCREVLGRRGVSSLKVVSNLPYAVATPAVLNLLESELPIELFVLLVQEEIAQRFCAAPNSRDYGVAGILAQFLGRVEILRRVPPQLFFPAPKVTSAVMRIHPSPPPLNTHDYDIFKNFIKILFSQRRKTISKSLAGREIAFMTGKRTVAREEVISALSRLEMNPNARPQELAPGRLIDLFRALGSEKT